MESKRVQRGRQNTDKLVLPRLGFKHGLLERRWVNRGSRIHDLQSFSLHARHRRGLLSN
jgi:hypothetical protein